MREAWRQIGEVLRANEAINRTQLGMLVSEATYVKSVAGLAEVQGLAVTAPMFARVLGSPTTIRHLAGESRLTSAAFSGSFRKLTRPRGLVARRSFANRGGAAPLASVVRAVNEGRATADPPKPVRTTDTWESAVAGPVSGIPGWLRPLLRSTALLVILAICADHVRLRHPRVAGLSRFSLLIPLAFAAVAAIAAIVTRAGKLADQLSAGEALDPAKLTPAAIAAAPAPADFALREPGVSAPPAGVPSDAATAANFRTALIGFADVFATLPVEAAAAPALRPRRWRTARSWRRSTRSPRSRAG